MKKIKKLFRRLFGRRKKNKNVLKFQKKVRAGLIQSY